MKKYIGSLFDVDFFAYKKTTINTKAQRLRVSKDIEEAIYKSKLRENIFLVVDRNKVI